MSRLLLAPGALVLLALTPSCGGGGRVKADVFFEAASSNFPQDVAELKQSAKDGYIACVAALDRTPSASFDFDIARAFDVVPVRLDINLISSGARVSLNPNVLEPVLFLENGTALEQVKPRDLRDNIKEEHRAEFDNRVFRGALLQDMGGSMSRAIGYLFFAVPEGAVRRDASLSLAGEGGAGYTVALDRSLLRFNYELTTEGQSTSRTIHVGTE